jgi:hypothetical protein
LRCRRAGRGGRAARTCRARIRSFLGPQTRAPWALPRPSTCAAADLRRAALRPQALNLILLTAIEVKELRTLLRDARARPAGADVFTALYSCWSHSAGGGSAGQGRGGPGETMPRFIGEAAVSGFSQWAEARRSSGLQLGRAWYVCVSSLPGIVLPRRQRLPQRADPANRQSNVWQRRALQDVLAHRRGPTHLARRPNAPALPGALLSLCLLAQAYDHASDLIEALAAMDISTEHLVQASGGD